MIVITSKLAAVQATAPDTIVTVMARDGLQTAADVSLVVLGAFLVVLLLVLVVLLLQLRKLNRTVRSLGDRALRKADPIVESGKGVADNVEFISAAVRTDVERLSDTVKDLNDRMRNASDRMEERIEEFNALMEVVQGEAEDIFLGTAATARGVREGVRALNRDDDGRPSLRKPRATAGDADRPAGSAAGSPPSDGVPERAPHDEDEVFLTSPDEEAGDEEAGGEEHR